MFMIEGVLKSGVPTSVCVIVPAVSHCNPSCCVIPYLPNVQASLNGHADLKAEHQTNSSTWPPPAREEAAKSSSGQAYQRSRSPQAPLVRPHVKTAPHREGLSRTTSRPSFAGGGGHKPRGGSTLPWGRRDGAIQAAEDAPITFTSRTSHPQSPTRLTEGNVARMLVENRASSSASGVRVPFGGWLTTDRSKTEGVGQGWVGMAEEGEIGSLGRVRRYMHARHGERAARQARMTKATRHILQSL